jgi:hypothetical protein
VLDPEGDQTNNYPDGTDTLHPSAAGHQALANAAYATLAASVPGCSFPAISAPMGERTAVEGSITTLVGGTVRTDSDRFDLSLDGETFTPTIEVEAGTTDVWLGVTPQQVTGRCPRRSGCRYDDTDLGPDAAADARARRG